MKKMTKNKLTIIFLIVLAGLLIVIGWLGFQQQKAAAKTAKSKTELIKVKTDLEKAESELVRITQAREKLEEQLTQLTKERDDVANQAKDAQATIDNLKVQLKDQIAKADGLQAIIDQLENKLKKEAEEIKDTKLLGLIFTTGLTDNNTPENSLTEIPINEERIYIFTKWQLSLKEHNYVAKIFDDSGKLISERRYKFIPQQTIWNTWSWYTINKHIDKPGRWKIEVYLDGRKMGESYLMVLPQEEGDSIERPVRGEGRPSQV